MADDELGSPLSACGDLGRQRGGHHLGNHGVGRHLRPSVRPDDASGTVVGGIRVGGLPATQAVSSVRASVEDPLHRKIEVRTGSFQTETTPWELGLQVDVPSAVSGAMGQSHKDNLLQRV